MLSPNSHIILLSILFADTASNGLSGAFVNHPCDVARIATCRNDAPTRLAFQPQKVEDSDFHAPPESFTFTRYATATVTSEYVQSEWKENDVSKRLSYLDVISSTASVSDSLDKKQDAIETANPDDSLAQAHRIQQAYREWCEFYDKTPSKERLGVFASNFLAVEEFHAQTGRPLVLNEFADLTEEEYLKDKLSSTSDDKAATTDKFGERIREAYRQWCDYYGRVYDEKRLQTFALNFIAVEKYHMQTKESLVLNEFADMTEPEYRKHLATAAHFTTPENIGPRSDKDSSSLSQETREVIKPNDDPITSYLDPDPNPIGYSPIEGLKPPIIPKSESPIVQSPIAQSPIVQSDSQNVNPGLSSDAKEPLDDSSPSLDNNVLATLQRTVDSLTSMVKSLAEAPPVAPQPQAQPLDSLVIDLLQQQDGSIFELETSVEGLHDIQQQSSDLIELVSNNQRQMTELMEAVQSEVSSLQQDRIQVEENYALLLSRIEELEATVAKFDSNDPVLNRSLVLSQGTATRQGRFELEPNLPPIGYKQPNIFP